MKFYHDFDDKTTIEQLMKNTKGESTDLYQQLKNRRIFVL